MNYLNATVFACLRRLSAGVVAVLLGLAQPTWAAFTVNGDATVTDSTTSLVWDQCPYGLTDATCTTGTVFTGSWADALDVAVAANAASYKGFTDWRLPNKNELHSIAIVDTFTNGQPAIDTTVFPGTPLQRFWTSTTYAPNPSSAWFVRFFNGDANAFPKSNSYYVRLVRGGQSFASFDNLTMQTTSFSNPGTQFFGTAPTLTATASSGLTPTFTSSTAGVCTITSGGLLTFVSTGTCTIAADQAGDGSYSAAPQISQSFTVTQGSQTITFADPGSQAFGTAPTLNATASSGLTPVFTSSTTGVCTITTGGALTFVATGTCTINADQAGNANYTAASQVSRGFTVSAGAQIITFANPGTQTFGTAPTLTATASSGLAPAFMSSTTGVCTITTSGALTFATAGTCTINADQAGNTNFAAASQVSQTFTVSAAAQTITFANPGTQTFGTTPTLTATASSGLIPSFTSSTTGVCTITGGGALTFVSTGSCTINADQAGSTNYAAASQVSRTFAVSATVQTITFGAAPTVTTTSSAAVSATGGASGIALVYASTTPAACTVNASTGVVSGLVAGTANCTITADQAGGANFSAAAQASQTFSILLTSQAIALGAAPTLVFGGAGTVSATGGASGSPLLFGSSTPTTCTVNASTGVIAPLAAGTSNCAITVNQAGNATYSAAPQVALTLSIAQRSQNISFGGAPVVMVGLSGTASASGGTSGNPVVFASGTPAACSVSTSGLVTGLVSGTNNCTITANQAGTTNYLAAAQATQTVSVAATGGSFATASGEQRNLLSTGQVSLASGSSLTVADGIGTVGSILQLPSPAVGTSPGVRSSVELVVGGQALGFSPNTSGTELLLVQGLINGQPQALPQVQTGSTAVTAPANAVWLVVGGVGTANGGTVLSAGEAGVQASVTKEASGNTTVVVVGGSLSLPCTSATVCAPGQTSLVVLAGETLLLGSNGKVLGVQVGEPAPIAQLPEGTVREFLPVNLNGTHARLGGRTYREMLAQALQTAYAALPTATVSTFNSLNGLSIGFGSSSFSGQALPPITINPALPDGVLELPDGNLQVVNNGVVVRLIPTPTVVADFGTLLQGITPPMGASLLASGNLRLGQNQILIAARPAFFSSTSSVQGAAQGSRFEIGPDGLLRFISVVGSVQTTQVIAPAVRNLGQFTAGLTKLDPASTLAVRADGKLDLSLAGVRYTLTPDYQVTVGSLQSLFTGGSGADFVLKDGKVFINYPSGFVQGFSVEAR